MWRDAMRRIMGASLGQGLMAPAIECYRCGLGDFEFETLIELDGIILGWVRCDQCGYEAPFKAETKDHD